MADSSKSAKGSILGDTFSSKNHETDSWVNCEGYMCRLNSNNNLRRYWFSLWGNQLFCYRSKEDSTHKGMHSLNQIKVQLEKEETINGDIVWPVKLYFPANKARIYYL